jgi:hypothetical protein
MFDQQSQMLDRAEWSHPAYRIRVRGTKYLWGSGGITQDISFASPLILHVGNDLFGQPVTLATQTAAGTTNKLGTLQPGECVSIPIQGFSGVSANCATDSMVSCIIKA